MNIYLKKTLVAAGILAGAAGAYAQGSLDWVDGQRGFTIAIISPDTINSAQEFTGNTSWDAPSGGASYTGGWIGGTASAPGRRSRPTPANGAAGYNYQLNGNFEVGLYVDTSAALVQADILTGTPVALGGIQGGATAGLFDTTMPIVTAPFAPGTPVYVGIAAWDTVYGVNINSMAAALWGDPYGYVVSASPVTLGPAGSPTGLAGIGLTSFSLVVPEPGTVVLGVIGVSVFLMRLRRKP